MEIISARGTWDVPSFCMCGMNVRAVSSMSVLGVMVDNAGSDRCAWEHRLTQAWVHWMEREAVLCSNKIPLRLRWKRIRETIFRTLLYGAGAWAPTTALNSALCAFENKILKRTLG